MQTLKIDATNYNSLKLTSSGIMKLISNHPEFISIHEHDDGETATCCIDRSDIGETVVKYGIDDAEKENSFLSKELPWEKLGPSLRKIRARRYCFEKAFPELSGVKES